MTTQETYAAITIYHEARGEPIDGMVAVAHVIFNRAIQRRQSVEEVVFADKQFSCYNNNKRPSVKNYHALIRCQQAVRSALAERTLGRTLYHANHYLNESEVIKKYGHLPAWVHKMNKVAKIGNHTFYVTTPNAKAIGLLDRGQALLPQS